MASADKIVGDFIVNVVRSQWDRIRLDRKRSSAGRFLGTLVWQAVGCLLLWLVTSALLHVELAVILWLVFLLLNWVARRVFIVQRWILAYRLTLADDALKYPGHRAAWKFWRAEVNHRKELRKQFHAACLRLGITGAMKQTPTLHEMTTESNGDITAVVHPGPMAAKGGVREIRAQRDDIAAICGCAGGVSVKPFGASSGNQAASARMTFHWEKRDWPSLPIQQLPTTPVGRISLGNDRELRPASIPLGRSTLLVAMTGMGKSKTMWTILVGIEQKVRSVLYAVDPKGGQEMSKIAKLVGQTVGRRQYAAYGNDSEAEAYRVIVAAEQAMKRQQRAMAAKDIAEWDESLADEFPLIVLVIDEMMEFLGKISAANKPGKAAEAALISMLSQGRAAGMMVIMSSQVSDKEVLGNNRTLIFTRVVLGTESPIQTGMAFGNMQAEQEGALCSEINEPGIAYIREQGTRGYREIRICHVEKDDIDDIAVTGMPANMGDDGTDKVEAWRPHWNYRYFTSRTALIDGVQVAPGQLAYTGETNNVDRRHAEHVRDFQSGKRDQWMQWVDPNQRPLITYAPSEKHAKAVESFEIANYHPIGNIMENQRSPWFRQPPVTIPMVRPDWRKKTRAERRAERKQHNGANPIAAVPHRPAPVAYLTPRKPKPQDGYRPGRTQPALIEESA